MKPSSESRKEAGQRKSPLSAKCLRIGLWNVWTLYEAGKLAQAAREMGRYSLHICGISETHWSQSGELNLSTGERFVHSGHDEGPHRGGVGVLMSKQAVRTLRYWKHEGPRIIIASFITKHKGINLNIIQAYAPTNEAAEEDKDCFYNQLQSTVENLSVNILMGDMNAKVGEEVMGIHGIGQVNDNGKRFKGLCGFNQLVIGGTIFPHKTVHKASWVSLDGRTENQIDHFTISKKFLARCKSDEGCRYWIRSPSFGWKSEDKTKKVWKFILQGGKASEVPSQPITGPTKTTGIPPRAEKQI